MTGRRNAAKSPEKRISGQRITLALGPLAEPVATAADQGREWIATVWDRKNGRPHKCLERPAYVRIVPRLPWLRKYEG